MTQWVRKQKIVPGSLVKFPLMKDQQLIAQKKFD